MSSQRDPVDSDAEALDSATCAVLDALQRTGHYDAVMAELTTGEMCDVVEAVNRARRRGVQSTGGGLFAEAGSSS